MTHTTKIGVLGGSGLYDLEGLENVSSTSLSTPFGAPSDDYVTGTLDGIEMVFLPRHGRGHRISPSEINYRANIWGMKSLGVTQLVSVSAVGSMREDVEPGHFVVVDQFVDRTRHRQDTFFEGGVVAHVMFADPVCPVVRRALLGACSTAGVTAHDGGAYLCMEGPQFSTRAESKTYRSWGVDVIGMTNLTEAKLAREAELCYATVAMSTDYDCWHEGHDDVTVEAILAVMAQNVGNAKEVIRHVVPALAAASTSDGVGCGCGSALAGAILTAPDAISPEARMRLGLLIDHRLG